MPTTTTRLALSKPLGTETVDIAVLNANADKLDAAAGATICTSTTRPSTPYAGQIIYETDTSYYYVYSSGWKLVNPVLSKNYLHNSAFDIWQRGYSFTVNGYGPDRWYLLGANTTWTRDVATVQIGTRFSAKATMTGAGQPIIVQAVPTTEAVSLQGKTATLSAYLASNISMLAYVQLQYSTSVDTSVLGAWTTINTTTTSALSSTLTRYSVSGVVPTNAASIRVVIGSNGTLTAANTFYVAAAQLEEGSLPTVFRRNGSSTTEELDTCCEYYQTSYTDVPPGTANHGGAHYSGGLYEHTTASYMASMVTLRVRMRATPSITLYHPATGAAGGVLKDRMGVASYSGTAYVEGSATSSMRFMVYTHPDSNAVSQFAFHYAASADL